LTPLTIEKNYKSILVTFCITNFIFNMGISVVVPFYPSLANEEAGLNFGIIGFVISCSPLGSIFGGLLIAPRLHVYRLYIYLENWKKINADCITDCASYFSIYVWDSTIYYN